MPAWPRLMDCRATPGAFVQIDISAEGGPQAWTRPVHAWFKRTADGWRTVGLTRMPGL